MVHFAGICRKYPFLRLILPLIIGIHLCNSFLYASRQAWIGAIVCLALSVLFFTLHFLKQKYTLRWLWGMGTMFLFLSLGITSSAFHAGKIHSDFEEKAHVYTGTVVKPVQEKNKSMLCTVDLEQMWDSTKNKSTHSRVLVYIPKDSVSRNICIGDKLLFNSKIRSPHNNGNPYEFDHATFLYHQGIGGTAYAPTGKWKLLSHENSFNIRLSAWSCREKVLNIYRQLGFKDDRFSVLSALTVGYKEELSEEVKHSYSTAGVSHLLALSGLHIGLFYMLLDFMLRRANRNKLTRLFKQLFIISCLWAFAFIAGLPPSVIRSVIMFSLVAFSGFFNGRPATLNTLAATAFFMLLYDPFYLYDISFRLSFLSVAGIVIIQPYLYGKLEIKNHFLQYIWKLSTVSIAAQVATAPLIIYYFSSFPIHFLWTNLLAIPLVTLILYMAIIMLLLGFCLPIQSALAFIVMELLRFLNGFTSFVDHLPLASVNNIYLYKTDVWGIYIILFLLATYLVFHKRKAFIASLFCILILSSFHLADSLLKSNEPYILFYNNRNCPAVHFIKSKEKSFLLSVRGDSVEEKLKYAASRFWSVEHFSTPTVLPDDYNSPTIYNHKGIVNFGGKTVCLVNNDYWKQMTGASLPIDYLYICSGYKGNIIDLKELFIVRKVVLDSSLSDYRLAALKRECGELGLDFISISEKGCYHINL